MSKIRVCRYCGKKLGKLCHGSQRYCSTECRKKSKIKKVITSLKKHELISIKKFKKTNLVDKTGKVKRKCQNCKKEYYAYVSQIKLRGSRFCSNKCKYEWRSKQIPKKRTLDDIWSEIIKIKAGNKCEFENCTKTTYLNSHHIFSRTNLSLRWDINNGICLCSGHHLLKNDSAHKAPIEFIEWLKIKRGENWYNYLRKKYRENSKKIDYLEIKKELEKIKEDLINKGKVNDTIKN
jgi:hypothetical protein